MALRSMHCLAVLPIWIVSVTLASSARGADSIPRRLYHLTIETGMPHLEENLRYSTTHTSLCLARQQLLVSFPILQHASLQGCKLDQEQPDGDVVSYALVCTAQQTTGKAVWDVGVHRMTGTLEVKLGGKNMTFYQRVTAVPADECAHASGFHFRNRFAAPGR